MLANNLQQKIFQAAQFNIPGAPVIANKFAPSISKKLLTRTPGNVQANPEVPSSITTKVPVGSPISPMDLDPGRSLPLAFTLVIDCSTVGSGTGSGQTIFVLFDHSKYHQKRNAISSAIPAGAVYVESTTNNLYDPIVNDTCSESYHFYGVTVRATAVSTATITPQQQVNQNVVMHRHDSDGSEQALLRLNQFYDPTQYDSTKQIVPLQGRFSRIDKRTAWVYKVYNGLIVEIDFFFMAGTRD